jgi:hypothetical protein
MTEIASMHILKLDIYCFGKLKQYLFLQLIKVTSYVFLMALQLLWALAAFQFPDLFTGGRTHWTSDQLVARHLPKHRTAQAQNKQIYTLNVHDLSVTRTHDHSFRASEDSSCLRPLGYPDQLASERAKTVHALDRSATVTGVYIWVQSEG